MSKIGISIDYSNICTDYNTVYLDRDNDDKESNACMRKAMKWTADFLNEMMEVFNYKIYRLNSNTVLSVDEIARKRFLFYSLEKEMLSQNFIFLNSHVEYNSLAKWGEESVNSLMIKNDDDGEGIYLYFDKESEVHMWILNRLKDFSLESVEFTEK